MGLFPCIRRGGDRWWLPRSELATEAIGHLMLASVRSARNQSASESTIGSEVSIDSATRQSVGRAIQSDPTLLIFCTLNSIASNSRTSNRTDDRVETDQLVDWLVQHAADCFASGDAFLGAPAISPSMQTRWNKLRDHFRVLPIERWIDDAALWLEVTGPKVSNAWQQQWPRYVTRSNESLDAPESTTDCMLQQLARVTQRQRSLEESFDQRLHETKLLAIKELAYGLSHEINNPLANISTRAQQLQRAEQDSSRVATLQRIIDQVYRAHEMIADLMFYANPPTAKLSPCDVIPIVQSVADSFDEETQRQNIRLEVTAPEEPTLVNADAEMIGEAVRVLLRNAVEAIGCQGTIVVAIAGNGEQVKVHIADSGPGLSDKARRHAFDPYFSGREAGRGLGLGLCRAYRIASLHNADISLTGGPAGCVATIELTQAAESAK